MDYYSLYCTVWTVQYYYCVKQKQGTILINYEVQYSFDENQIKCRYYQDFTLTSLIDV